MGLFKRKEKSGIKCPACGSFNTCVAKGTQAIVSYPGFYSGISSDSAALKNKLQKCKDCKNVFQIDS